MAADLCSHVCDDRLELYALGRLPDAETAEIEEHLLVCESCRLNLAEADRFIAALRYAAAAFDADAPARPKPAGGSTRARGRWRHFPVLVPLVAVAAFILLAFVPTLRPSLRLRPSSEAVLSATRADWRVLPSLAAARVTTLDLDATELSGSGSWSIRIVDDRGSVVWTATGRESSGLVAVRIGRRLGRGQYWARLYDASAPSLLAREFGFSVR